MSLVTVGVSRFLKCAESFSVHFVTRAIGARCSTCWIILCTSEHFRQVCARAKLSPQEMIRLCIRKQLFKMASSSVIVAEAMLEDNIWLDYSCLYDVRCPEFQGFVHIFRLTALKRLRRNNKRSSKISSSSDELQSCSPGTSRYILLGKMPWMHPRYKFQNIAMEYKPASNSHVQWTSNIVRMRIRVISWADSFARAHTWRKCSLVNKIIQHVEYLAPMARVTKCTENDSAHWRNLLTLTVTSDTL